MRRIEIGYLKISPKGKRYVNEVMNNNRLSYGPFTKQFESLFASLHGVKYAVAASSGTAALHVALAAMKEKFKWKDGDEVLVPATTFIATSNIVIYNNLVPVFVDIDPDYYEIDPTKIERHITKRTRAILPVHLFGQPADMKPIMDIAKKRRLRVLEDSCETMGATYRRKSVGSFGDIGCFSTYVAHLLPTGVGGLSTTNDPELAVMLRSLVNHGRDSIYLSIDDDNKVSKNKLHTIMEKRFSFVRLGQSARITELESAIGLAQLEDEFLDQIKRRRANAAIYAELLEPFSDRVQLPRIRPGSEHSFMMYPIILRKENKRKLVEFLEDNGVETRDLLPLINQPVYKKLFKLKAKDYPVSKWLIDSGFYIGCHHGLKRADIVYVASLFRRFFSK